MSVVSTSPDPRPSRVSHHGALEARTRHRRALPWLLLLILWALTIGLLAIGANAVVTFTL